MAHRRLVLLLPLLLMVLAVRGAHTSTATQLKPRQLQTCPAEHETVIEPLPASVGDTILELASNLSLITVDILNNQHVLRIEDRKLLLNQSIEYGENLGGTYIGPFPLICSSESEAEFVAFNLYLQVPDPPETPDRPPTTSHRPPTTSDRPPTTSHRPPTTSDRPPTTSHRPDPKVECQPSEPRMMPLAVVTGLLGAACIALSIALAIVVRRRHGGIPAVAMSSRSSFNGGSCKPSYLLASSDTNGSSSEPADV